MNFDSQWSFTTLARVFLLTCWRLIDLSRYPKVFSISLVTLVFSTISKLTNLRGNKYSVEYLVSVLLIPHFPPPEKNDPFHYLTLHIHTRVHIVKYCGFFQFLYLFQFSPQFQNWQLKEEIIYSVEFCFSFVNTNPLPEKNVPFHNFTYTYYLYI